jgi:hypothetical protein
MERSSDEPESAEHSFDTGRNSCIHNVPSIQVLSSSFYFIFSEKKYFFFHTISANNSWTNLNDSDVMLLIYNLKDL